MDISNFTPHLQQFSVSRQNVKPEKPEPAAPQDDVEETKNNGTSKSIDDAAYNAAYNEAVEKAEAFFKENYPKIDNPADGCSYNIIFTVGEQQYVLTATPTYHKHSDGSYYLMPEDPKSIDEGMTFSYEVQDRDKDKEYVATTSGKVNIDYSSDKPSSWTVINNYAVENHDGTFTAHEQTFYEGYKLKNHLPEDIIAKFFTENSEGSDMYTLADNCKSIELVSNDKNGTPKYKIVYTDENGKEKEMYFEVATTQNNRGKKSLEAENVNTVDVEERNQRQQNTAEVINKLKSFSASRQIKTN